MHPLWSATVLCSLILSSILLHFTSSLLTPPLPVSQAALGCIFIKKSLDLSGGRDENSDDGGRGWKAPAFSVVRNHLPTIPVTNCYDRPAMRLTCTYENLWCSTCFSSLCHLSSSPLSSPLPRDQGQDAMSGPGDLSVNHEEDKMQ